MPPEPQIGFRTFGCGKMGNLDKLCGSMNPGETVSKLRSTPAPYLAQAPALKQRIVSVEFGPGDSIEVDASGERLTFEKRTAKAPV